MCLIAEYVLAESFNFGQSLFTWGLEEGCLPPEPLNVRAEAFRIKKSRKTAHFL